MGGGKGKVICNIGQLGQWLNDLQASTCHREIQGEDQEKKKEKTYLIRSIYLILTSALYARSTAKHEKTTYGVAIRQNGNCPPSPPLHRRIHHREKRQKQKQNWRPRELTHKERMERWRSKYFQNSTQYTTQKRAPFQLIPDNWARKHTVKIGKRAWCQR